MYKCDVCGKDKSRAGKPFTEMGLVDHKRSAHLIDIDGKHYDSTNEMVWANLNPIPGDRGWKHFEDMVDIITEGESDGVADAMRWELMGGW